MAADKQQEQRAPVVAGKAQPHREDPMEKIVRDALKQSGLEFVEETDPRSKGLDFYLPCPDIHIEVKQFHSDRIAKQMSRAKNVIAIQGIDAARFFGGMLPVATKEETEFGNQTRGEAVPTKSKLN